MLNQVRYFQAVVRHGSFTEVAEECHISQSAISQQIKALEEELGVQLLENISLDLTYFYLLSNIKHRCTILQMTDYLKLLWTSLFTLTTCDTVTCFSTTLHQLSILPCPFL